MSNTGGCVLPRACRHLQRSAASLAITVFLSATLFAQMPTPAAQSVGPEHDNPLARELWFRKGRIVPGKPGAAARLLQRAYQQKMQLRAAHAARTGTAAMAAYSSTLSPATASSASTTGYGGWVPLGPSPIHSNATGSLEEQDYGPVTGRATSVVVDPGDPTGNTVYLGGAYGGLWKSTNAAASSPSAVTWTPLLDQQATLAVGSVAVQPSSSGPSNVILVGTGEADFSIDSYYGLGILRSADGGNTWTLIPSAQQNPFAGLAIAKIAFSTDNPNLVVAAAVGAGNEEGASIGANSIPGLFTSSDGGQTWSETEFGLPLGPGFIGGATSVIYDAASHKFFAFLQFEGYFTSKDGLNWSQLASQPGTALHNCPGTCSAFRGEMAVVPGREELYTWYVTIDQQGNIGDGGIYKTTNGGGSWQEVNDDGILSCGDGTGNGCGVEQGWFNLTLAAVPTSSGTDLYAGAVNLYKCSITPSNGLCGTNPFINLTHVYGCSPLGSLAHVHPDQHGISFLRLSAAQVIMYFANDGGIYRALNGYALRSGTCGSATNPFQDLNGTMGSMSEFVDFSNAPTDAATVLGGTQDNGSPATDATYGTSWISVNGGDGGYNVIDPNSPDTWFTTNTDVSVQRCNDGINCLAQTFDPIVTNSTVGGDHGFFYTPFILDPQADSRMLVGTCRLWRGNSDGSGFTALSYNFDTVMNQFPNQACSGGETQLIRSIAAGGPNTGKGSSVIYVGTEGGYDANGNAIPANIWVTNNADLGPFTWANLLSVGANGYAVSSVVMDPSDPTGNTAYASVMGFGEHVLQTINQGVTWTWVGNGMPNAPVNAVLIDPDDSSTLYAATDVGVYVIHGLLTWTELGQLPNVAVLQLKMFESGGVKELRAGTYGRGVWSYAIPYQIRITTPHVYLLPGQSGTINGIITGYNGYSSPVDIECLYTSFGTCTGTTVTPMPSGTPFSLNITAGTNVVWSDYGAVLQGTGTDPNATVETSDSLTVSVTDFFLSGPGSIAVNQGASVQANVDVSAYYQPITLSCSNLPAATSCNFLPSPVAEPSTFSQTLGVTVSAGTSTPTGSYSLTVSGTAPSQPSPKTVTIPLSVGNSPDYSFVVTPVVGVLTPGSSTTAQVVLTPAAGYTGPVSLSCSGSYVSCSLSPAGPFTLAGSPLTVTATLSVPAITSPPPASGVTQVYWYGNGPGTSAHSATLNVTVADFALSARYPSAAIDAGQPGEYELLINSAGATFTNPVSFSCSGLPSGAACSFSPARVTPNANGAPTFVVLSVSTPKTLAALRPPKPPAEGLLTLALLLPGMVVSLSGGVRRKRALFAVLLVVVLAAVTLQLACGGGANSAPPTGPTPTPTPTPSVPPPPVNYNFNVTATSGTVQHQISLTLAVQGQ